jgi:hypothetical protein
MTKLLLKNPDNPPLMANNSCFNCRFKLELIPTGRRSEARQLREQRVDHDIPDEKDLIVLQTSATQILNRGFARREKPVGDGIGHHAIDLFRNGPRAGAMLPSTWATGTPSLHAAMEQAMVDVTLRRRDTGRFFLSSTIVHPQP